MHAFSSMYLQNWVATLQCANRKSGSTSPTLIWYKPHHALHIKDLSMCLGVVQCLDDDWSGSIC